MWLRIVACGAHFYQPANSQRVYTSKITRDKTSAMRNVYISKVHCEGAHSL